MLPELKTNWKNSGRLHTEKAVSEKEVYIEVERVVVCHGLGDVALKCLTLGVLGCTGHANSFWFARACKHKKVFET